MPAFDAACAGVYLHGAAADAFRPQTFKNTDLLPQVYKPAAPKLIRASAYPGINLPENHEELSR